VWFVAKGAENIIVFEITYAFLNPKNTLIVDSQRYLYKIQQQLLA
jgi:hypothetical protein